MNKGIKTYKIGTINKSRVYIGLEVRPHKSDKIRIFRGPTYYGTTHGLIVSGGRLSLLAHTRDPKKSEENINL